MFDFVVWWCGNSGGRTAAVAAKPPNARGLYDVLGNVREWTWDRFAETLADATDPLGAVTGDYRVARGGSFADPAWGNRLAFRSGYLPSGADPGTGFRLVRRAP